MTTKITHCGRCHTCGTKLRAVMDGEEWCPKCQTYRRYQTHGWRWPMYATDKSPCPQYDDTWSTTEDNTVYRVTGSTDAAADFHPEGDRQ